MSKIKFYAILIFVILVLSGIGCTIGLFFTEVEKMYPMYYKNSIMMTILLSMISVFACFLIHELVHALTFKILGYHIRLFCIGPFSFFRSEEQLHFKFGFNSTIGIGGIVIPNISAKLISNIRKLKKDYSIAMITAPLVSFLLAVLSYFLIFHFIHKVSTQYQSSLFTICSTFLLVNMFITLQSLLKLGNVVGDFQAFHLYRKDDKFSISQLSFYALLSTERPRIRKNDDAIRNFMIDVLRDEEMELESSENITIIDYFLYEDLLYNRVIPEEINKYVKHFIESIELYTNKLVFESYYIFYTHLIYYMKKYEIEGYLNMWELLEKHIPNNRVGMYYMKQAKFNLFEEDYIECNTLNSEIVISSVDNVLGILDHYYDEEILMNQIIYNNIE